MRLSLLSELTVSLTSLESVLGFLSHCCEVVPLGRSFSVNFSLYFVDVMNGVAFAKFVFLEQPKKIFVDDKDSLES